MVCRIAAALTMAAALVGAAGCATTAHEAPPEVAPQPPQVTTQEAMLDAQESAAQDAATQDAAAQDASATQVPDTATVPSTAASRAQRFRPTARSTREILELSADAPRALDFSQRIDQVHDRIYAFGQGLVEATDHGFAANDKPLKPVPAAPFRLSTTLEVIDRADGVRPDIDLDFDIALNLPNLEERLRVFVTSDSLDSGTRERREDSRLRAGLRYQLLSNLDFDVGVRIALPPVAFTALRWSREVPLGSWDFYPLVKLFAETEQSVGYALGATFDRWSGRHLLRSSTFAKWRHDRGHTQWSHTFVYARAHELLVPDRYGSYIGAKDIGRGWGLAAQTSGGTTRQVDRYEASLFYHNRTPTRWLYWFAEPFVRWERRWNWSADPGIRIGVDALFWDLARPAR
jgi:hypothetical protein